MFRLFLSKMNDEGYPYVFALVTKDKLKWEEFIGMEILIKVDNKYLVGSETNGY